MVLSGLNWFSEVLQVYTGPNWFNQVLTGLVRGQSNKAIWHKYTYSIL
jgi:hypothetical protein